MDAPEEKDKAFKVDDRRRFSPEGELKPEYREAPETATAQPTGDKSKFAEAATSEPRKEWPAGAGHAQSAAPEITFGTFLVSLSTQALLNLGEIPDPATGQPVRDLSAAQQLIDVIGILREKTRGNLDRNEEGLIEAILFDLRMKYVQIARQPAR